MLEYGFRYYHPELGRWLSRDQGGEGWTIDEWDLYAFVRNKSINHIDLIGRQLYPGQPPEDVIGPIMPGPGGAPPPGWWDFEPILPDPKPDPDPNSGHDYEGQYICRRYPEMDGRGAYVNDDGQCCMIGFCTYECTPAPGSPQDAPFTDICFEFETCDTSKVIRGLNIGFLERYSPSTIQLTLRLYGSGAFDTPDVPPNSPPTNAGNPVELF